MDALGSHHTENSKHGETSVVDFDIEFLNLVGRVIVKSNTKVPSSKVTGFLAFALFDGNLVNTNKDGHLHPSCQGDGLESTETIGNIRKLKIGRGAEEPLEMVVLLDKLTNGCSHGNTSVLYLHTTVVEEVLFRGSVGSILNESEGAVNAVIVVVVDIIWMNGSCKFVCSKIRIQTRTNTNTNTRIFYRNETYSKKPMGGRAPTSSLGLRAPRTELDVDWLAGAKAEAEAAKRRARTVRTMVNVLCMRVIDVDVAPG